MNILITGSGGRAHTLAWKLKQSEHCENLFIAPGNAGTALEGTNLNIDVTDFEGLKNAAIEHDIQLIIVGPEEPLVKGIVDFFANDDQTKDILVIGPSKNAAQLEGSKAFAKAFMQRHGIPTAPYREFIFETYHEGVQFIKEQQLPVVIKADGLAAGKGVLICNSHLEALAEFELIIHRAKFGQAGKKVVVESFLTGIELSVFALTDGKNYILFPEAKDYKRIGEGDKGLNTGGMGAVSPVPFFDAVLKQKVITTIIDPTIRGLQKDNLDYKGFIFFGLMVDKGEPTVIEYNCRLGDPETEVIIPRINSDLVEIFSAVGQQKLNEISIDIDNRSAVSIMAVSGGYPGKFYSGKQINGLQDSTINDSIVFHAGTLKQGEDFVTNGGRVFAVTAFGDNIKEASELSNYMMEQLYFEDMAYRSDIGYEFI